MMNDRTIVTQIYPPRRLSTVDRHLAILHFMNQPRPLIDAHLDLAMNALAYDRDLEADLASIRANETAMTDDSARAHATVCFPEMRAANLGLCVATLIARSKPNIQHPNAGYKRTQIDHASQAHAHCVARGQLAYYQLLHDKGVIRIIHNRQQLDEHWNQFTSDGGDDKHGESSGAVGLILSLEGADPIITPDHLPDWHAKGLRAIGPCHFGPSHYGIGSGGDGPLTIAGVELLAVMQSLNMILDVTHLSDTSLLQAVDLYQGPIWASHHNCRALVSHDRQLTDDMIRLLIERDAVIGSVLCNWMLHEGYESATTPRSAITLQNVADHIDHVCQLASNTHHAAIGSDLDGGFGYEMSPNDLDSIADIQKLDAILASRGYTDADINNIFHNNWLRILRTSLPA